MPVAAAWKGAASTLFSRIRRVMATYWLTVLSLASRDAGTITPTPAATALSPVTASSRPMITATIHAAILSIWSSDTSAEATRSLSAMGSSNVPRVVTWLRRRAMTPSSQSVMDARMKITAAISASTRDDEMRKTMSNGTAKMRVIVRTIGKFTPTFPCRCRRAAPLSSAHDDLVNVGPVHGHQRGGVETEAGIDIRPPPGADQVARPARILAQAPQGRGVALGHPGRFARRRGEIARRIALGQQGDEKTGTDLVLERHGPSLAGTCQGHSTPGRRRPGRCGREVDEPRHPDGRCLSRGEEGARAVAGGEDDDATPDVWPGHLEG